MKQTLHFFAAHFLLSVALFVLLSAVSPARSDPAEYFTIKVVDAETSAGIPLVELKTTNDVTYFTDSAGVVAFHEPGLMNRKVFFSVSSPGYLYPADGFGIHGAALNTRPGGNAVLKMTRINIAERLYRLTGEGIYRDSVLAGLPAPSRSPVLNGDVVGQDTVLSVVYRNQIHWFWGDSSRPDYPLGNFHTSGAVSALTDDPALAVNFTYFTSSDGFARAMLPIKEPGPVWVSATAAVDAGTKLITFYSRMESLARCVERGLALYNDDKQEFERIAQFSTAEPLPLDGHPVTASDGKTTYLVGTVEGAAPVPCVRVPNRLAALKDRKAYEAFTCLKAAQNLDHPEVNRDAIGRPAYRWTADAPALTFAMEQKLIAADKLKPDEGIFHFRDIVTGKTIHPHAGSVYWNAFRRRWIMILEQVGGEASNIGEIWFAEADTPVGPWAYARLIATHPHYDFYNPTQHPFFDSDHGRTIYFEGTFVNTFSGNPFAVPRYNYNQLLYRLKLDDGRLLLPVPVYRLASGELRTREGLHLPGDAGVLSELPFYALPAKGLLAGRVPVYQSGSDLQITAPGPTALPLFYALPAGAAQQPETLPLKNFKGDVIARVWRSPQRVPIADFSLTPKDSEGRRNQFRKSP